MSYWMALLSAAIAVGMPPVAAASDQDILAYVTGSTKKVCQLTGDFDRELGRPTLSQTGRRYGVIATDLGSSFEHNGRLFFLFGDTWGRPGDRDAVAWTTSSSPEKIVLRFHQAPDGKWLPLTVPGVDLGAFEVPSGGVSVGGKMCVAVTTDWSAEKGLMGRSVLAVSQDDGKSFQALYDLSKTKFINVSFWSSDGWLYIFGSGAYRKSSVSLARVRPKELPDRSRLLYFSGSGPEGSPLWSSREQDAVPLFRHDVIGEFSVVYCKPVGRYVMLYNSYSPRGIIMRSAATPWGPWSEGTVVFDPWRDGGYGHFMHVPTSVKADTRDAVNDPGREAEWGGEYGPYLMARFTTGGKGHCRLFYTMSTWNPYQVVVMQTDLKLETHGSQPDDPGKRR
ncbi:MAG: DUF4185 domain-containing protein [Armatimonadetes bacterium]|nr:DUF4185 domain-containing protein [Armatimonadota bacterium]